MTNLDIAHAAPDDATRDVALVAARAELVRMSTSLGAVRALSDAQLVDDAWFDEVDLAELVDGVATTIAAASGLDIVTTGDDPAYLRVWEDGVRLAVENLLRNATTHGSPSGAGSPTVTVTVDLARRSIVVNDGGPGIPDAERARLVLPFERGANTIEGGATRIEGTGLGLSFVDRVAAAHGGTLDLGRSPAGGLRAVLTLGPAVTVDR
jgi:signal transduction histidine kinase